MFPLSTYYEQEVKSWLRDNPGKVVTVRDVGAEELMQEPLHSKIPQRASLKQS